MKKRNQQREVKAMNDNEEKSSVLRERRERKLQKKREDKAEKRKNKALINNKVPRSETTKVATEEANSKNERKKPPVPTSDVEKAHASDSIATVEKEESMKKRERVRKNSEMKAKLRKKSMKPKPTDQHSFDYNVNNNPRKLRERQEEARAKGAALGLKIVIGRPDEGQEAVSTMDPLVPITSKSELAAPEIENRLKSPTQRKIRAAGAPMIQGQVNNKGKIRAGVVLSPRSVKRATNVRGRAKVKKPNFDSNPLAAPQQKRPKEKRGKKKRVAKREGGHKAVDGSSAHHLQRTPEETPAATSITAEPLPTL